MHSQRWVYIVLIVVGAALGIAIAGLPTSHYDTPLHNATTTTAPQLPSP